MLAKGETRILHSDDWLTVSLQLINRLGPQSSARQRGTGQLDLSEGRFIALYQPLALFKYLRQ